MLNVTSELGRLPFPGLWIDKAGMRAVEQIQRAGQRGSMNELDMLPPTDVISDSPVPSREEREDSIMLY